MPSIVGTWKLAHATARDAAGAVLPAPYGGKGIGRVMFTAEGRMMSVVCDGRPELPVGTPRDYSSYCGNYTFDGARLVTRSMRHPIQAASAAIKCAACVSRTAA
jgi:hypothetical protein